MYGDASLQRLYLGSGGGGGAGGGGGSRQGTPGGNGGGIIVITASSLDIRGEILSDGQDGSANDNTGTPENGCNQSQGSGGGGGGSGGTIWLSSPTLRFARPPGSERSRILARGGGTEDDCPLDGGAGGNGRVRMDFRTLEATRFNGEPIEDPIGDPVKLEGSCAAAELAENASDPSPGVVGGF